LLVPTNERTSGGMRTWILSDSGKHGMAAHAGALCVLWGTGHTTLPDAIVAHGAGALTLWLFLHTLLNLHTLHAHYFDASRSASAIEPPSVWCLARRVTDEGRQAHLHAFVCAVRAYTTGCDVSVYMWLYRLQRPYRWLASSWNMESRHAWSRLLPVHTRIDGFASQEQDTVAYFQLGTRKSVWYADAPATMSNASVDAWQAVWKTNAQNDTVLPMHASAQQHIPHMRIYRSMFAGLRDDADSSRAASNGVTWAEWMHTCMHSGVRTHALSLTAHCRLYAQRVWAQLCAWRTWRIVAYMTCSAHAVATTQCTQTYDAPVCGTLIAEEIAVQARAHHVEWVLLDAVTWPLSPWAHAQRHWAPRFDPMRPAFRVVRWQMHTFASDHVRDTHAVKPGDRPISVRAFADAFQEGAMCMRQAYTT
jgi:hypothetical protein